MEMKGRLTPRCLPPVARITGPLLSLPNHFAQTVMFSSPRTSADRLILWLDRGTRWSISTCNDPLEVRQETRGEYLAAPRSLVSRAGTARRCKPIAHTSAISAWAAIGSPLVLG